MKTTGRFREFIRGCCISSPLALFILVPCASSAAPGLEFEAGAGGAVADSLAPMLSARLGLAWKNFVPSLRVLSVVGATPQYVPGGRYGIDGKGYQGTAFFGELRLRAEVSERCRLFLALGAGVGKLSGSSAGLEEDYPTEGRTSHYEQVSIGVQYLVSKRFSLSLEVGINNWNGLTFRRPAYSSNAGEIYERNGALQGGIFLLSGVFAPGPS
ncbi:MAG TPA: hypothetical protein VN918_10575 [Myxococcaceae bacterium]|nr:hypothetical protein [Myxococcaceae bacterium]